MLRSINQQQAIQKLDDGTPLEKSGEHFHADERGVLHKCFHKCRTEIVSIGFWVGLTLGYPLEHFLWEHVVPFCYLTEWMGMLH